MTGTATRDAKANGGAAGDPHSDGPLVPDRDPDGQVRWWEVDRVLRAAAKGTAQHVREAIAEAMAPLLARIAELEGKPRMAYDGTWEEGKTYTRGSFCTHQGGLWHCEDTNTGVRPGTGSSSWKLAVKRGRGDR